MELLAPVGSKESFITAIRGGANAVYMGVPDFNARVSAANITLFDLKVLIDYAHQKNVKVFLALNTLIKHEEINDVVKNIAYIAKLNPDAFIVQDLGIAGIIREYYPDIALHASTQMAVHNRMGVDFLACQGFKRVIMARELSFSELKSIVKGAPAQIEIFCHGALCFSLSGMCLFSSFIGGLSGNRGRCTQPCRRLWEQGKKRGYMFSPKDLELAEYVNKLKNIGIASLKIEGRMRSSEYVYRVVKAYRMLIDAGAADADFDRVLKEARAILSGDAAREKTTCLLFGRDNTIFQPHKAQCLGNSIGTIDAITAGSISVKVPDESITIIEGDRLRLSNPASDITIAFKVKETPVKDGLKYVIPFSKAGEFAVGNPVFKTVDASLDQKNIEQDIDSIYQNFEKNKPHEKYGEQNFSQKYTALISNQWKALKNKPLGEVEDSLYIRFDNIQWLDILPAPDKNTTYVFYLTKENLHLSSKLPSDSAQNLAGELPPFIGQRDIGLFKQCIDKMILTGVKKWVVNNVSHLEYFKDTDCELTAGHFLYTWNAYTAAFLSKFGVKYFVTSWEDDFLNIRKMCGPGLGSSLIVYLYGFVPVARSRLITGEMLSGEMIKSTAPSASAETGNRQTFAFSPAFESELALLLPEKPLSLFTGRRKLKECGISKFGIGLNYIEPDKKLWHTIFSGYKQQENIPESVKFNFKQGIK